MLLAPYGRSQMGVLVDETLRAGRILAASQPIDPERIAITGMSLGGQAAWCCQSATMGQIGTRENCCYGEATLSFLTVRL